MRIICTFLLCLFSLAVTLVVGGSREAPKSPAQDAHLNPAPENSYERAIADVSFIGSTDVWASEFSGTALYHIDNELSPRKQATDFGGKTFLSFINRRTGFAFAYKVGRASLWRTTDGGEHWQKVNDTDRTIPDYQFTVVSRLYFADEQHGWLANVFGIWRIEDGGARWKEVFSTANHEGVDELFQVSFSGFERAMVTARSGIYLTVDGGKFWKLINKNTGFSAICSLDEHTSWAWGDSLERTDDGGNSWHQVYKLNRAEIAATQFINKNEGWAAGLELPESFGSTVRNPTAPPSYGILLHTKDGGKNWDHAPVPTDTRFQRVSFSDSKHGWLLGTNKLYRTTDGVTWSIALELR
jgi:photosystem II stability/assembly factor-like uncharacterized protein